MQTQPSCDQVRLALSALIDGQWPELGRAQVLAHQRTCLPCRRWEAQVRDVEALVADGVPQPPPHLDQRMLDSLPARRGWASAQVSRALPRGGGWPARGALLATGAAAAALAVPEVLYGVGESFVHVQRELGSLTLALAAGLVAAALWPRWARSFLPSFGVLTALLVITSVADIRAGHVHASHEVTHGLFILGFGLLLAVSWSQDKRQGRGLDSQPHPWRRPATQP